MARATGSKLVTAEEAVSHVRSGDRVVISIAQSTPFTLCTSLAGRLMELENVVVNHGACIFNWDLRRASAASSVRKSGCATAISSRARSLTDFPRRVAIPYSVTT